MIKNRISQAQNKVKEYWHMLGPGLTTGAADDDPAGIATYSQAGAGYGFTFLWTALFTFPLMAIVQEMCARIGIVTGRGLAGAVSHYYSRRILYVWSVLLFVANTFNIGADLGIMAKAVETLVPLNFSLLLIAFAGISLYLQIFRSYQSYAKILKWTAFILLTYVAAGLIIRIDWPAALHATLVPHMGFNRDSTLLLTAILGTTISPYLFFWQTSQEVELQIQDGKKTIKQREAVTTAQDVREMRVDVWSGMLLSNLVMFFIIVVCAATLYSHGVTRITDAAQAAQALRPLAGNLAYSLFTLGIVGTGMLAIPILAGSSSYAISESFGWPEGLYRKFREAQAFYGIIIVSMLVGFVMNLMHLDSIKVLIYSAVLNGLVAPFILAVIVLLASNKKVMKQWVNHPFITFVGWVLTLLMAVCAIATIWFWLR